MRKRKIKIPVDPARSQMMRRVKSANTKPERIVRSNVYALGYRYRLNVKSLPGRPDLVFRSKRRVIFVHGCFWHGHDCKRGARIPITNQNYWVQKIERNKERDKRNLSALQEMGWRTLVIWECDIKNTNNLIPLLKEFLN